MTHGGAIMPNGVVITSFGGGLLIITPKKIFFIERVTHLRVSEARRGRKVLAFFSHLKRRGGVPSSAAFILRVING